MRFPTVLAVAAVIIIGTTEAAKDQAAKNVFTPESPSEDVNERKLQDEPIFFVASNPGYKLSRWKAYPKSWL